MAATGYDTKRELFGQFITEKQITILGAMSLLNDNGWGILGLHLLKQDKKTAKLVLESGDKEAIIEYLIEISLTLITSCVSDSSSSSTSTSLPTSAESVSYSSTSSSSSTVSST